ncbi:MAG: hemolysin, partial [Bacteroidales bacterium]|nr:hemolysin [Bacteroidales bacterium]
SDEFFNDYLPYTIELGRSFVQPKYQKGRYARKGLFALDNLWDGLGAITIEYPDVKYFFGKVTMYKHFDVEARNTLLSFMHLYFPDKDNLIITPTQIDVDFAKYQKQFKGNDYKADYKLLGSVLKESGERIPPLINTYMNISPSMRTFGTIENPYFGGVEETGILISIDDIYAAKKDRHIITYKRMAKFKSLVKSKLKIKRIRKKKRDK